MKTLIKPTPEELSGRQGAPLTDDGLFADGPTPAEFVAAGFKIEHYPPAGYAPRADAKAVRKHYEAHNSNRVIRGKTLDFSFSPYQHMAGTWMGTYSTDKPEEIAELDLLVENKKSGVYLMTDVEYENALKKKVLTLQGSGQSLIHSEAAISRNQQSVKAADLPDTEPKAPEPTKPEGADTLQLAETKVPEATGSEGQGAS